MTSIIAGGAGFIGINLAKKLISEGSDVIIIDNFSNSKKRFIPADLDNLTIIENDLSSIKETKQAINKSCELAKTTPEVWHMAANSDIPSGLKDSNIDLQDTFMTTFNLLEACKCSNILSFYFASSSAIYGDHGNTLISEKTSPLMPISNYGAMKLASEAQCYASSELFLKKLRIFRFPNVVGAPATHGVIFDFINKLKNDPTYLEVLGDGTQEKSYLHVSDLISGMIHLKKRKLDKEEFPIFNLGPQSDAVTIKWIAEEVVKHVSPKAKIYYGKSNKGWVGDIPKFRYDTSKASSAGWYPSYNSKEAVTLAIRDIIKINDLPYKI